MAKKQKKLTEHEYTMLSSALIGMEAGESKEINGVVVYLRECDNFGRMVFSASGRTWGGWEPLLYHLAK